MSVPCQSGSVQNFSQVETTQLLIVIYQNFELIHIE